MIENKGGTDQKMITNYDEVYDLPDVRGWYRAMDQDGFESAQHASDVFRAILAELKRTRGLSSAVVTDFASGYGIATTLMRHSATLEDVLSRYRLPAFADTRPADVIEADRVWLAGLKDENQDRYAGVDVAGNALAYGQAVGIFDAIFPENLQQSAPSAALTAWLAECDLVVECGSVAHMMPGAMENLMRATQQRGAWIVITPIRGNDRAEALELMADYGRTVELLDIPPFRHRPFVSEAERATGITNARARGHDTSGFEDRGHLYAQVYLARPAAETTPFSNWPAAD